MQGTLTDVLQIDGSISVIASIEANISQDTSIEFDAELNDAVILDAELSDAESLLCGISDTESMDGTITIPSIIGATYYDGSYDVTPSNAEQTLSTADLLMRRNVTINPIPSNYGLITWNGSVLTVS